MVAYYPGSWSNTVWSALDVLIGNEQLVLAKNGGGQFFSPEWFSDAADLWMVSPDEGYLLWVTDDTEFVWPGPLDRGSGAFTCRAAQLEHFPTPVNTGRNMSVVIHSLGDIELQEGAEIACFTNADLVAGAVAIEGEPPYGMAIWGDDRWSEPVDGFGDGEPLRLVYWDPTEEVEHELTADIVVGDELAYQTNGFLVIDASYNGAQDRVPQPAQFTLSEPHPNPFNPYTAVEVGVGTAGQVWLGIYDPLGRLLGSADAASAPGQTLKFLIDGTNLQSGVYLIRVSSGGRSLTKRAVILK
jgi:hypothetical protein